MGGGLAQQQTSARPLSAVKFCNLLADPIHYPRQNAEVLFAVYSVTSKYVGMPRVPLHVCLCVCVSACAPGPGAGARRAAGLTARLSNRAGGRGGGARGFGAPQTFEGGMFEGRKVFFVQMRATRGPRAGRTLRVVGRSTQNSALFILYGGQDATNGHS